MKSQKVLTMFSVVIALCLLQINHSQLTPQITSQPPIQGTTIVNGAVTVGPFVPFNATDSNETMIVNYYNNLSIQVTGHVKSTEAILTQIGTTTPNVDQSNSLQVLILLLDSAQRQINITRAQRRLWYSYFGPLTVTNLWGCEHYINDMAENEELRIIKVLSLESAFIGLTLPQAVAFIKQQTMAGILQVKYANEMGSPLGLGAGTAYNPNILQLSLNGYIIQAIFFVAFIMLFA